MRGVPSLVLPIPWKDLLYERVPTPLKSFKMVDPSPNAPLLKRIVRHPYAMEPLGTKRVDLIDPEYQVTRATGRMRREPVEIIFAARRDARHRSTVQAPDPIEVRPHPFARQRDLEEV